MWARRVRLICTHRVYTGTNGTRKRWTVARTLRHSTRTNDYARVAWRSTTLKGPRENPGRARRPTRLASPFMSERSSLRTSCRKMKPYPQKSTVSQQTWWTVQTYGHQQNVLKRGLKLSRRIRPKQTNWLAVSASAMETVLPALAHSELF